MKKYYINVNGVIYKNLTLKEAQNIIKNNIKNINDWFYLYEQKRGVKNVI